MPWCRAGESMLTAQVSRSSSRSRPNSRLQDRLAKAVNKGKEGADSRPSSEIGSRPESPAPKNPSIDVPRASIDSRMSEPVAPPEIPLDSKPELPKGGPAGAEPSPRPSVDVTAVSPPASSIVSEQPPSMPAPTMAIPSILAPQTTSPRQSVDSSRSRPSIEISTPAEPISASQDPETLQVELSALQTTHDEMLREHRDELNAHLERIDALQSKLTYLSQQLASSAKASDPEATPADKRLAEKDAQIAALMEEGQKLSKMEMKHVTTIKKMRAKALESEKDMTNLKQRLSKAERAIAEQTDRAKRAEAAEKVAQDKLKVVAKIEKDIELIRSEREEAGLTIAELRRQLSDALTRAEDAGKRAQTGALEAEKRVTASLQEDIENLRIEKKLAEDRAKKDLQEAKDEATRQQERANVSELELRGEIAVGFSRGCPVLFQAYVICRTLSPNSSFFEAAPKKSPLRRLAIPRPSCSVRSKPSKPSTPSHPKIGRVSKGPLPPVLQPWKRTVTKRQSVKPTFAEKPERSIPKHADWKMN